MRILKTLALTPPASALAATATLYKSRRCGCCEGNAEHLRDKDEKFIATHDLTLIDCHVAEGRASAAAVKRLLAKCQPVKGILLPGMLFGSSGMQRPTSEPLVTYAFGGNGGSRVFGVE